MEPGSDQSAEPAREAPDALAAVSWLFLRLLGLVSLFAFLSLIPQVRGLIGAHGISPAADLLDAARGQLGSERYRLLPTVLWAGCSDGALLLVRWVGVGASLLLLVGAIPAFAAAAVWVCYLSITTVGQEFLQYQWDALLLEALPLAVLLSPLALFDRPSVPRPRAFVWLVRWLLFRLMLGSGLVKLERRRPALAAPPRADGPLRDAAAADAARLARAPGAGVVPALLGGGGPILRLTNLAAPLRVANVYGLFAVMTNPRWEIVLEGSDDGVTWSEIPFRWKPQALTKAPPIVAPHMPRLDWQMWFAALEPGPEAVPWFASFARKLLEGEPAVWGLLAPGPFGPAHPPRYLRAARYGMHFTDIKTLRATGCWWRRDAAKVFLPEVTRDAGS